MADIASLSPQMLTDPRMALAQQLMQTGTTDTPIRSWTQELAKALSGISGAVIANKVRGEQTGALSQIGDNAFGAGTPNSSAAPAQPDMMQRIGNFLGVGGAPGGNAQPSAGPTPSNMPAPDPSNPTAPMPSGPSSAAPAQAATPVAQQMAYAKNLYLTGKSLNNPFGASLMQQALTMRQNILTEQAKAQIDTTGVLARQGMQLDPTSNTVTPLGGYQDIAAGNKQAETRGGKLGEADPSVTAAQIAQTNAENVGTSASAAAKSAATAQANALAENSPAVADAAAAKAAGVAHSTALATSAPDVAAQEAAKAQGIAQAQEQTKADFAGKIAAATTDAQNQVNAGKPLTPDQKVSLQQSASQAFVSEPQVKEHYETSKSYQNVLKAAAGTDKASDINLIDAVAKLFNPGGVIRQGSFNIIQNEVQGLPSNILGEIKGAYSNQAHLSPDARAALVQQATSRMASSRDTYNQFANFAAQTATANGLNPQAVVPKFIDPLTAQQEIARRQAIQQQQPAPQ